ncbi:hypothetical protein DOTSEDRAFT_75167 [Dothistroma septosporum NZE10]|uniref:C2H2-type domain-containing protein n=1 Tax=Dothistroma septosporum (strain NZE10 / CBS 128990) TaxID=675120 RepID=M2YKI2_DOTSN|nr:hypothetical protein DOTSEDRAFT_75167 [Dothistroma septosporum NZE10]
MPRTLKRHGLVMDGTDWRSSGASGPPCLTLSLSSSNESIDNLMPSTPRSKPSTPTSEKTMSMALSSSSFRSGSMLLPGFHFSTTDAGVDAAEFHRIAEQLLSGEQSKRDSAISDGTTEAARPRQLHCDLGKDPTGRYCCSCGKSYSTQLRLREHTKACAGTTDYPCPTCDKLFPTQIRLDRHISSRHNNNKEACPECGEMFPANWLPKHLASGLGGCDGMVQVSLGPTPKIDQAYQHSARASTSQRYWIYDGDLRWRRSLANQPDPGTKEHEVAEQTRSFVTRLLQRPKAEEASEPCNLCGEVFENQDALTQHIGEHSLDFNEKRHRCDECMIYFAHEKDLERHLQSVNLNQHCGFTFRHCAGTCTGHHPPTYYKSSLCNDHNLMQKHLWSWELCQLRGHRATVARLLAHRVSQTALPHMSVQDCKRSYYSVLPHMSIASRDSVLPGTGSAQQRRPSETSELDAHFSRIVSQTYPKEDPRIKELQRASTVIGARPDSVILPGARECKNMSKRKSFIDLAKRKTVLDGVKYGHKRGSSHPLNFLRRTASTEDARPQSLPVPGNTPLAASST